MAELIKPVAGEEQKNPSLSASIHDGVSHAVMMGAGETYIGPFGIFLGASTLQVGLLATMPQLFGAFMQLAGARLMPMFGSRRGAVVTGALIQASLWVPMAFLPFFFGKGIFSVFILIGFVSLYFGANGVVVPIWNSLIGDIVPSQNRGRFFGSRNRLSGISTFTALALAGIVLHFYQRAGMAEVGYLIIFIAAFIARLNSARWLARYDDPKILIMPEQLFTFRQFLRRSPHSNFAKFVFFVGGINLGVAFSAPYFTLYMLRDLKMSYIEFTAIVAVSTITQFLTFRHWGTLSDRFGNKKILSICGWGVAIVPILWLAKPYTAYLVLIQVFGGFVWAGFNLSVANFMFDAVSPSKRALCVAYQGLINGACVFIGSISGGITATLLPEVYELGSYIWKPSSILPILFFLSGILRLIAAGIMLRKFREVRPVEPIGTRELIFRVSHLKPIAGASFSLFTGLFSGHRSETSRKEKNTGRSNVEPYK